MCMTSDSSAKTPAAFDEALSRRGLEPMSASLLAMDEARRSLIHQSETAKAEINALSKAAEAARGDEASFA